MLAARLQGVKPSATVSISARAAELRAEGKDVISLSAGEPDFDTPEKVKNAAMEAIRNGQTKYTAVDGTPQLKKAIQHKLAKENQLNYEVNELIVSNGAKQSIFNAFAVLLSPGDEVIIPAPYWVSYPDMARLLDASPIIVSCGQESKFKLAADTLAAAVTEKSKILLLNSPSNPTGACYSEAELAELAQVLRQHPQVVVVTDDIYEHIKFDGIPFKNILNVAPDLRDRVVVVNGVSKAYAMTGWRIGYAAGPANIVKAMKTYQGQCTSNPCSISQAAATQALYMDASELGEMVAAFKQRHDYVVNRLNAMTNVSCLPAQGAFYAFPNFQQVLSNMETIEDDVQLARELIDKANVAVVPGSAFGASGFLRLSYATSMENLTQALDSLEAYLKSIDVDAASISAVESRS